MVACRKVSFNVIQLLGADAPAVPGVHGLCLGGLPRKMGGFPTPNDRSWDMSGWLEPPCRSHPPLASLFRWPVRCAIDLEELARSLSLMTHDNVAQQVPNMAQNGVVSHFLSFLHHFWVTSTVKRSAELSAAVPRLCHQDRLWVARFNGGACGCYDPRSGALLAEVHVPKEAGRQVGMSQAAQGGK